MYFCLTLSEATYQSLFNIPIEMARPKKQNLTITQGESEQLRIDYANLRGAVLVLRSVNHPLRQRIIEVLKTEDKMTVTEIYIKLRIEQSVASQHLAILRKSGIVIPERAGKYIHYSLDQERLNNIVKLVSDLAA